MISVGLDLSINSTGVCIHDPAWTHGVYYVVSSKFTKKSLDYHHDRLSLVLYNKQPIESQTEYHRKEAIKTNNIYNIVSILHSILEQYKPDVATIEGVSFQSNGSVLDLCGLNYMVRMMLQEMNIPYYIVSPTQNKKFATGNGQAEKDVMISAWKKMDQSICDIPSYIKTDDIADAYFLARYGERLISEC